MVFILYAEVKLKNCEHLTAVNHEDTYANETNKNGKCEYGRWKEECVCLSVCMCVLIFLISTVVGEFYKYYLCLLYREKHI